MLDKWIGEKPLVTILQNDYNLDFVNARYINRYVPYLSLNNYKCYNIRINNIINNDNNRINVIFFHFTKSMIVPKTLSTRLKFSLALSNSISDDSSRYILIILVVVNICSLKIP